MNDFWSVVSEKMIEELEKLHKITHNSIKNTGSTLILTNLVEVYPRNIYTNPCIGLRDKVN